MAVVLCEVVVVGVLVLYYVVVIVNVEKIKGVIKVFDIIGTH